MRRVLLLVAGGVLAGAAVLIPAGGGAVSVAPNQLYEGKVNGSQGPVAVYVVCTGTATTGPPKAGQKVDITQAPGGKSTSNANKIVATFDQDSAPPVGSVELVSYDTPTDFPTGLMLPCLSSGSGGTITFKPNGGGTTDVVAVNYTRTAS